MTNTQILVVEDEPIVAKNIQLELTSMGYAVPSTASSGLEALRKVEETNPDLVLMDIVLKGDMDGIETTEQLRGRFDIPVVYLTAYADEQTLQRAKETEPFGYLLKPYEERELQTTIEVALYKHKTERVLKEIERWLTSTLRSIADAVIVTDCKGYVRILNRAAETLTGWSQVEALGKDLIEVFPVTDDGVLTNPASRALQKGAAVNLPKQSLLVAKDGRETSVEGCVAPIHDDRGWFTGFVITFRDATAHQRAKESVPAGEGEPHARQQMETMGRLAAGMAHDFNQLLTVILSNLSMALSSVPKTDPNRERLAAAEMAAAHAAQVVKQLFRYSRETEMRREPLCLNDAVREMVAFLSCLLDPRTEIEFTPAPGLWTVRADHAGINEVLLNLCLNAQDAMPDGGQILVQIENVVVEKDCCPAHPRARPGEYVCLRVSDAGRGMPPEIRARIFESFFTTKRPEKGTGLGLRLVCDVVEQHEGWIDCHSGVNQGTRFEIYLPRHRPEAVTVQEPQVAAAPRAVCLAV